MKTLKFALICTALIFGAFGCDKPAEKPAEAEAEAEAPAANAEAEKAPEEEEPAADAKPAEAPAAKIEISAAGQKLDPPVKPEQLPAGAWYCDMGTAHWAAMDKPDDGKCPECNMALKQMAAAPAGEKADGHDHAHGDHDGHDH